MGTFDLMQLLAGDDVQMAYLEQQLGQLIDRLVHGIEEAAGSADFPLPYSSLDWLWRRLAFATMLYVRQESSPVIMLNLMVLKVARMVNGPGGCERLEKFVTKRGYVHAPGDTRIE
jgi:hypothetical protein